MTTLNISAGIIRSYPDQNPFELDPLPYSLIPHSMELERQDDTPQFIEAARAMAAYGSNPLRWMYGTNPFILIDDRLLDEKMPLEPGPRPPSDIGHPEGKTVLVTVQLEGHVRLLKIKESEAYAHLLKAGVCARGYVQMCYGWLELTPEHVAQVAALPGASYMAQYLGYRAGPIRALLLEYFVDAQQLSIDNVSEKVAEAAMRALCEINKAHVLHGDIEGRNILVLPGERVVLVDFNYAKCPHGPQSVIRQDFFFELGKAWTYLYGQLLPDQRIGFHYTIPE
ncbi:uncharacterized protein PHACADRAFT_178071 [Phanerochaete carnosa HHB-10118-sp]|uniref:Protein kinase domain-containing protein n=1 Tax=Phanerochaete carnosa (strain HHB-10118-sp) TaxID=650164 RepID=K5WMC3_PHACS|nr:uncharacterized protein PHACADRAFT_178071 [Phanerochaete carnosa HHB-10118-sp]EKM51442.1 hypothetical protein PHACADRAFT_178071 [Phanerochaete carnosa HHB-10118-sp]